ncbi:MAG: hypothetical protein ACK5M7_19150 [Draconibacterium sp.]
MKGKITENYILFAILSLIVLIQIAFLFLNTTTYGGADNITHYQVARYAFKYPRLFLDLWGKPLYTTLVAPFALMGFSVAKAFNLLVAVITLILSAKNAKKMFVASSAFTIVFIAFSPVYFFLMLSCLTEVLFSLVAVMAVYFFLKNKWLAAAIILSFIPFVRTEGMVLLPVFAVAFLLKKQYKAIPFLLLGTLFYSIIGFFVFNDALWLIHQMPYSLGDSDYGSGSLFHFIKKSNYIFGIPFLLLLVIGLIFWPLQVLRKFSLKDENLIHFILITGSWAIYFAAHSYVWWKGTGSSLGLIRVIGGVIPLAALTAVKGIEYIFSVLKNKKIAYIIIGFIAVLQVAWLFAQNHFPLKADPTEQLMARSGAYIKQELPTQKVFYFDPLLIHYLDIDPYDVSKCNWWVADRNQPSNSMDWGNILVWDAHFGPNEGGVQLETLRNDPFLNEVKAFYPIEKITVLGGYDYSIHIFEKSREKISPSEKVAEFNKVLSFENSDSKCVEEIEGEKLWKMDAGQEYGPTLKLQLDQLELHDIFDIKIRVNYKALETIGADEVMLVFSVEDGQNKIRYDKIDLMSDTDEWKSTVLTQKMPTDISPSADILVYVWNKDRKALLLKDIMLDVQSY